ncbi:MAG: hypothetical protein ABI884_13010 [Gemmatimonadota bacterium]
MRSSRTIARATLVASSFYAVAFLAACSDSSGPSNGGSSNLSIAVATISSAPAGQVAGAHGLAPSFDRHVSGTDSTHALVITRVAIALSRLHLATVDSAGCAADDHPEANDDRCRELASGPMLVELPVDNSVISVLSLQLPAGSYRALEAKIRAVQASDSGGAAFIAAHPEFANAGVRVEGTFDGRPFIYSGSPNASLELGFDPPITVGTAATSVTVHVSIDRWFTNGSGNLVDPATANVGGANENLVSDNVRRSFHAFEDNEHHGDDGHGDDGFANGGNDGTGHEGGDDHGGEGSRTH